MLLLSISAQPDVFEQVVWLLFSAEDPQIVLVKAFQLLDHLNQDLLLAPDDVDLLVDGLLLADDGDFQLVALGYLFV